MIAWMRAVGAIAILLGGVSIVGFSFWWGSGFVYLGLAMLIVDAGLEPTLTAKWKFLAISFIAILATTFSSGVVFVSSPLAVVYKLDADYTPGTIVDGVAWKDGLTKATFVIRNDTGHHYRDVQLFLRSNLIFIKASPAFGAAKCESHPLADIADAKEGWFDSSGRTYRVEEVPDLVLRSNVIRVTCDDFPPGELFALTAIAASDKLTGQRTQDGKITQLNFDATYKGWLGRPEILKKEIKLK